MTALTDQCNVIRGWLNLGDEVYPDLVVTSWIRMAEEKLSKEMRCKDMIQIDTGTLIEQRYLLPPDWREMDFIRAIGGKPLRYASRDDFYNTDEPYKSDQKNCYTMVGNYIATGIASAAAPVIEISYYGDVPPLGDNPTWLSTKYTTVYLLSTLGIASMYSIEDERQGTWDSEVERLIGTINEEHAYSRASGSRLTVRHRKGFG